MAPLLQLVMHDLGVTPDDNIGDSVGQVGSLADSNMLLNNAGPATGAGTQQITRMRGQIGFAGNEQKMDWLIDRNPIRQMEIGTVAHESHV